MADDWEAVGSPQESDDWQAVSSAPPATQAVGDIPDAFLNRVRAGQALYRITQGAISGAKEGIQGGTPTGFEDETLNHLIDLGIFHDPAKGRPGPLQMVNEAVMIPAASLWQTVNRALAGGIHGAGGTMEQLATEFGASQGAANRARNEVINFGNWAMIEAGMGRFSRPTVEAGDVADRPVGGLPTEADFKAASRIYINRDPAVVEANLRRMWSEDGIHPAEAVHDAQADAFVKHEITAPRMEIKPDPEAEKELEATGGKPGSLSAAATDAPDISPADQPTSRPGSLIAAATDAADKLFDIGRDIQMKLAPMARGSVESMATVKDYMNAMRRNAWDSSRIDTDLAKRFTADQRERMARAMEEESLSIRLGEPAEARQHQGLATLEPEERQAVLDLDKAQQLAWLRARDAGVVEGDGIPMHFPRMAIGAAKGESEIGKAPSLTQMYGIRKNSPYLKQRQYMEAEETEKALKAKYGEGAKIAWDIRAVNLATKMLEDATAGRTLVKNIEDVGKRTGEETVAVGWKPGDGWFTVDHPAFQKWRPRLGDDGVVKDADGNVQFEQVPIYVRGDFEGPIRAALWGKTGDAYKGLMAIKGKTMGLIMNSPMIHNLVEYGRAFPAMPLRMMTLKTYFDGYRAKADPGIMHEAISNGLVPIGKRFFNQDINTIMESPDLTPGRSWTAKVLSAVPGLFDEAAGTAVKQAIDKAGDFWHNTLLWDRIGDLQAGLYVNFRGDLIAKGMDEQTASRVAAHFANRYAGALPKEAMSEAATKLSNFMFFSRSFTFGNMGVMKDMLTGLPKDVLAQIERDSGFGKKVFIGYHGTHELFDKFSDAKMGTGVGASFTKGQGHFFATDPAEASGYAEGTAGAGNVRRAQLNFKNPKILEKNQHGIKDIIDNDEQLSEMIKEAVDQGHDGLVLKDVKKRGADIVVSFGDDTIENIAYGKAPDLSTIKSDVRGWARGIARRKAMMIVGLDVAAMVVGNSVLQSAFNVMLGDSTLTQEGHEYLRRARDVLNQVEVHPLSLLQPMQIAERISATGDNEPTRRDRVRIGYAKDGTAIYARNPIGKIGEEFANWFSSPLDMLRKKEGTIARPMMQILSNDAGFGRKIYDPQADSPARYAGNVWNIVKHIAGSQLPVGQITAFSDLVKGEGDAKVNAMQAFGPFAGVTFSKGAPGGPAVGEMYDARSQHEYAVSQAMPDIKRMILRGDVDGARGKMTELGINPGLQKWYIKSTLNPGTRLSARAMKDFNLYATEEQKARMNRARGVTAP